MPVYNIIIDQVQRLSYVDQLTLLCIFNSFNMKNNLYIDSMDLLHFEKKVSWIYCILGKKISVFIINL